jgi:hypothetical protein
MDIEKKMHLEISGWQDYVKLVRTKATEKFEKGILDIGMGTHTTYFIFTCYMNSVEPEECAKILMDKFPEVE